MNDLPETETQFIRRKTWLDHMLYWKLAIFKCAGKAALALALSIVASLNGNEWSSFSETQKFVAMVTAAAAMWQVVDTFLSTTMSDLQEKKDGTTPPK